MNPVHLAKLKVLQNMIGGTGGMGPAPMNSTPMPSMAPSVLNPMANMQAKERRETEVPLSTAKGLKESLTKKLKPKLGAYVKPQV